MMTLNSRQQQILNIIEQQPHSGASKIALQLSPPVSTPTLNRDLASLVGVGYLLKHGQGRGITYTLAPAYRLFKPVDLETYFLNEPDNRQAKHTFDDAVLEALESALCFSVEEQQHLTTLQQQYQHNIVTYPHALYKKELERLTIELSWKSSQIEGNTYSLLDTERLFLEQQKTPNKPDSDATMLLNHKTALEYLLAHPDLATTVSIRLIEELHTLLIEGLGVGRNLRSKTVGITGTAYKPLDTVYQIREALERICRLLNDKTFLFEKALLAVLLLSYLQPFEDGNKRTARMLGNALLIQGGMCPLSYRSVDSLEYKKAVLLFYEQGNLSAFKALFMEQVAFSVGNYFR